VLGQRRVKSAPRAPVSTAGVLWCQASA
jgi:hypothetical protein